MPIDIRCQSGAIDEVVAHGCDVHLERMDSGSYSLVVRADGVEYRFSAMCDKGRLEVMDDGAPVLTVN